MRCRREQHQGVRARRQQLGQPGTPREPRLAGTCGDVVAFVDHDDVPPGILEVVAVLEVALEGVDGNDAAVEVVEGVVIGGDAVAHPSQADRIQSHQRDGEAAPPLLLELGEHGLLRDDQDALAPAALNQFGGEHARFERLAEADRIGNQDARARLTKGLQRRVELVRNEVHHPAVAEVHLVVIGDVAPAQALQVQDAGVVGGRVVGDELGFLGVEDGYLVFERGEEQGRLAAHELGNAVAS